MLQIGNYQLIKTPEIIPEETPKELMGLLTLADSALYTHYNLPYYNPNKIYEKQGNYDLFEDMKEDDQISALLNLIKNLILGAEWCIECEDENVKEFIEWNFNNLDEIFIKKLYNILTAMEYGFSLTEIVLRQEGAQIVLDKLKTRMPKNFLFVLDDYGNVTDVIQQVKGPDIHIEPSKFIHYIYQSEFDNPYGKSALNQGIYRAWWSKNAIIKFWNIYLERHGMPFGYGTYPKGASPGGISDLKAIGKNIQSKTFAVFPEGFMIDFKEASKGTDNYEKAIDKYNMMMARAMLVPDLLGLSGGETGGGSYALGDKQFEMFYSIINFNRRQLERTITQKLVKPLVYYNFGNKYEAEFVFNAVDEKRRADMLTLWLNAVNGGKIPITDKHINWFLQNVEAPEIEQKELDQINADKEAMAEQISGGKEDGTDSTEEEEEGDSETAQDVEEDKKKEELTLKNYIALTQYEKRVDFVKIDNEMTELADKYKQQLADHYKLVVNALMDEIKRKKIIERKRFDLVNDLKLKNQASVNKTLKDILREGMEKGRGTVKRNYLIEDTVILNDDDLAAWIQNYAYFVSTEEAGFILGKVKPAIMEGIRSGAGVKEIMTMVDEALKGYDIALDANRIETIVRTVVSTAYNEGRAQQFNTIKDQIQAYQFSAILDGRTSKLCESLHGKILKPNQLSLYNCPLHYNCRSILVPVFIDDEFDGNFNIPAVARTQGNFVELA